MKSSAKLRQNYVASRKWICDCVSLIPTDLVYFVYPSTSCPSVVPCPVIARLNRIFRMPRMLEFFDRTETRTGYPNSFRICKVLHLKEIFKYKDFEKTKHRKHPIVLTYSITEYLYIFIRYRFVLIFKNTIHFVARENSFF